MALLKLDSLPESNSKKRSRVKEEDSAHQAEAHAVAAYLSWQKRASVCRVPPSRAEGKHFNLNQQLDVIHAKSPFDDQFRPFRSSVDNKDPVCVLADRYQVNDVLRCWPA